MPRSNLFLKTSRYLRRINLMQRSSANKGFKDVRILDGHTVFGGVTPASKIGGQHGTDKMYAAPMVAQLLEEAMGVVFQSPQHKNIIFSRWYHLASWKSIKLWRNLSQKSLCWMQDMPDSPDLMIRLSWVKTMYWKHQNWCRNRKLLPYIWMPSITWVCRAKSWSNLCMQIGSTAMSAIPQDGESLKFYANSLIFCGIFWDRLNVSNPGRYFSLKGQPFSAFYSSNGFWWFINRLIFQSTMCSTLRSNIRKTV